MKVTAIAVGGAFGAVLRYLISISPVADWLGKFPFHTFFINVSSSFLIGLLLVILTEKYAENEILRLALAVGFLGASTTFSTFELELYQLVRERFFSTALAYLALSIVVGFIGVAAGIFLGKKFI